MMTGTVVGVGPYACMPHPVLTQDRWAVHAVEPEHIESIRCWRNAQIDVLRQSTPINPAQQADYFLQHIWPQKPLAQPRNILLIYLQDEVPIGYGGLVHVAWEHRRAEVSFLLDPKVERTTDVGALFATWLNFMQLLAFTDLGLTRLCTETYAMRELHIRVLEACGFEKEGRLRNHVVINGKPTDTLMHGCLAD